MDKLIEESVEGSMNLQKRGTVLVVALSNFHWSKPIPLILRGELPALDSCSGDRDSMKKGWEYSKVFCLSRK